MAEVEPIPLEPVDALTVTTLVDNVTDILLGDEGPARRPPIGSGPRVPASVLIDGEAFDALRAEHGFAALVTVTRAGRQHRVLFDTGISPDGLVENMRRLELSPHDVDVIVLSHGHFDHVGGHGRAGARTAPRQPAGGDPSRGLEPATARAAGT